METLLKYPEVPRYPSLVAAGVIAVALQVGTGGEQTPEYYKQRGPMGYALVGYEPGPNIEEPSDIRTPAENLTHIRTVLKPAVIDIAHALGVSRQAVYDWQNGKPISVENADRLADLAHAADVFATEDLTAPAQLLRRPIVSGKTLFDMVRDGGSAEQAAQKLVQMVRRELQQRQMLAERLSNRKRPAMPSEDYGTPILEEQG
jgi:transcriptional regulator with XRE-family HTH domain